MLILNISEKLIPRILKKIGTSEAGISSGVTVRLYSRNLCILKNFASEFKIHYSKKALMDYNLILSYLIILLAN